MSVICRTMTDRDSARGHYGQIWPRVRCERGSNPNDLQGFPGGRRCNGRRGWVGGGLGGIIWKNLPCIESQRPAPKNSWNSGKRSRSHCGPTENSHRSCTIAVASIHLMSFWDGLGLSVAWAWRLQRARPVPEAEIIERPWFHSCMIAVQLRSTTEAFTRITSAMKAEPSSKALESTRTLRLYRLLSSGFTPWGPRFNDMWRRVTVLQQHPTTIITFRAGYNQFFCPQDD